MKTILITGRTDLVTSKLLEQLSGRFSVVLTSSDKDREEINARVYNVEPGTHAFEQLFWAYDFYAVWYFSPYCDGGVSIDDFSNTRVIYKFCRDNFVKKLIVVSSTLLSEEERGVEEGVLLSSDDMETGVVILRLPLVLVEGNQNTALGRVFQGMKRNVRTLPVPNMKNESFDFFPMRDAFSLMKKISLAGRENGVYNLPGEHVISRGQMQREISAAGCRTKLQSEGKVYNYCDEGDISQLMVRYGFTIRDKKQLEFLDLYEQYLEELKQNSGGRAAWLKKIPSRIPNQLAGVLDLVVLFVLSEVIRHYTVSVVYFNMVDVRLIYIFLIASFHGLRLGVLASLAVCVMLFLEYNSIGIYGNQLFYNVENWIPFALCIITGAVAGYFSDHRENERELVKRENDLLREKYLFLNDMYHVTSEVRDEYRTQILTFDNSYGKIYNALMHLNCDTKEEVCHKAWEVLSQLLNNATISFYRLDMPEGVLENITLAAGYTERRIGLASVRSGLAEMFEVTDQGDIWINTGLVPGMPMYAMQLLPGEKSQETEGESWQTGRQAESVLVVLWDALPEQMNDYYANQFEILCRLTGNALDRAALIESISE